MGKVILTTSIFYIQAANTPGIIKKLSSEARRTKRLRTVDISPTEP